MQNYAVFLGGVDLEMIAIASLLRGRSGVTLFDKSLGWGAKASDYLSEIREALARKEQVVLVELPDDLPEDIDRGAIHVIDHHGALAGRDRMTSLEQVFDFFEFPPSEWTRELALISANDRGYLDGMLELHATIAEMKEIRRRDRAAQGITHAQELEGQQAAERAETLFNGKLTVVHLPHTRTATVTDALDARLGGPGYQNLLVLMPDETCFFGDGELVQRLADRYPDCWYGGNLPKKGYWGVPRLLSLQEIKISLRL